MHIIVFNRFNAKYWGIRFDLCRLLTWKNRLILDRFFIDIIKKYLRSKNITSHNCIEWVALVCVFSFERRQYEHTPAINVYCYRYHMYAENANALNTTHNTRGKTIRHTHFTVNINKLFFTTSYDTSKPASFHEHLAGKKFACVEKSANWKHSKIKLYLSPITRPCKA